MAISKTIRDAMVSKLANVSTGFNATYAVAATAYGIPPLTFDFGPNSPQFYLFPVDIDLLLEEEVDPKFPVMLLYFMRAAQLPAQTRTKPAQFNGIVDFGVEVWHSWPQETSGRLDFETGMDAVTEALITVFNGSNVAWPSRTVYGGEFQEAARSPLGLSKEQGVWYRKQTFVISFRAWQ